MMECVASRECVALGKTKRYGDRWGRREIGPRCLSIGHDMGEQGAAGGHVHERRDTWSELVCDFCAQRGKTYAEHITTLIRGEATSRLPSSLFEIRAYDGDWGDAMWRCADRRDDGRHHLDQPRKLRSVPTEESARKLYANCMKGIAIELFVGRRRARGQRRSEPDGGAGDERRAAL